MVICVDKFGTVAKEWQTGVVVQLVLLFKKEDQRNMLLSLSLPGKVNKKLSHPKVRLRVEKIHFYMEISTLALECLWNPQLEVAK